MAIKQYGLNKNYSLKCGWTDWEQASERARDFPVWSNATALWQYRISEENYKMKLNGRKPIKYWELQLFQCASKFLNLSIDYGLEKSGFGYTECFGSFKSIEEMKPYVEKIKKLYFERYGGERLSL